MLKMSVFKFLTLMYALYLVECSKPEKTVLKIAVYYDDTYDDIDDVISYSVDSVNRAYSSSKFLFEIIMHKANKNDAFRITNQLCKDLTSGPVAVLAVGDSPIIMNLYSITNLLDVPFMYVKWDSIDDKNSFWSFASALEQQSNGEQTTTVAHQINQINFHPPIHVVMHAVLDLITFYKWEYVMILYEKSLGLNRIEDLIRLPVFNNKLKFTLKELDSNLDLWVDVLKEVRAIGTSHIIVDIKRKNLNKFFIMAEDVDIMTPYYHFLFTTFDLYGLDFVAPANITSFHIYQPNDEHVASLLAEFNLKNMVSRRQLFKFMPSEGLMIYDAFSFLAKTIEKYNLADKLSTSSPISCEESIPSELGSYLITHLKMNKMLGVSGYIEFDQKTGFRKNTTLSIVDKSKNGVDLLGFWRESSNVKPIEIIRSYAKTKDQVLDRLKRFLTVSTKLDAPFAMLKLPKNNEKLVGNARFRGYCIDLLEKISKMCGFNYTIQLVEDGKHGSEVNGKWNGMVGELINKKVDLVAAGLTISTVREAVIDFTNPFLNLGISILFKRPTKPQNFQIKFQFMEPLSFEVWMYMGLAFIVISLILFVLARFSPYEWKSNQPCKGEDGYLLENQWNINNSFWFSMGNLLRQGTNISASVSPSIRLISFVWGFFTLLLISSYTANLAAFLTVQRMKSSIESVEDLSKQTEVKYGTVMSGSTENFFKTSQISTYERMWKFMSSNPSVMVKSAEEGIARVRNGSYAFILESTQNEYIRQRDCELMQIGGLLDSKGYGIGLPTGSPWRDIISNAILQLQENGDLQELYTKWWELEDKDPDQKCDASDDKNENASELSLESVSGIFVIMAVGILLAFVIAIIEYLCKAKRTLVKGTPYLSYVKNGYKKTFSEFLEGEFETPFPKLGHEKKKYDALLEMAKIEAENEKNVDVDSLKIKNNSEEGTKNSEKDDINQETKLLEKQSSQLCENADPNVNIFSGDLSPSQVLNRQIQTKGYTSGLHLTSYLANQSSFDTDTDHKSSCSSSHKKRIKEKSNLSTLL